MKNRKVKVVCRYILFHVSRYNIWFRIRIISPESFKFTVWKNLAFRDHGEFCRILASILIHLVSIRKRAGLFRVIWVLVLEARKVGRSRRWRTPRWKSIPRGRDLSGRMFMQEWTRNRSRNESPRVGKLELTCCERVAATYSKRQVSKLPPRKISFVFLNLFF